MAPVPVDLYNTEPYVRGAEDYHTGTFGGEEHVIRSSRDDKLIMLSPAAYHKLRAFRPKDTRLPRYDSCCCRALRDELNVDKYVGQANDKTKLELKVPTYCSASL